MTTMNKNDCILITGGSGLVGTALTNLLREQGYTQVYSIGSRDCDLRSFEETSHVFNHIKPDYVFHLAARVHGLGGNSIYKADILVENTLINLNVVTNSRINKVKKIVAMGSGCVYPELTEGMDLTEDQIWLGEPHGSEDSYAHSKRLMLAHLEAEKKQYGLNYAFAISGNLYGPNDKFNDNEGHVTPSLIKKFYDAKKEKRPVRVWGHGIAIRDFTYSMDAARALFLIMSKANGAINLGSGFKHSIKDIVDELFKITGVPVEWDSTKPDGQKYRCYDVSKLIELGFVPKVKLQEGIANTWNWYITHQNEIRR